MSPISAHAKVSLHINKVFFPPTPIQSDDASIRRRTVVNEFGAYSRAALFNIFALLCGAQLRAALSRVNTVPVFQRWSLNQRIPRVRNGIPLFQRWSESLAALGTRMSSVVTRQSKGFGNGTDF